MFELILANFAMHITLDAAEVAHIKSVLQHRIVKKNGILLDAGEICRNIYFVNSGCLRVYNADKQGGEHNISFCPENWWAVDMASFSYLCNLIINRTKTALSAGFKANVFIMLCARNTCFSFFLQSFHST